MMPLVCSMPGRGVADVYDDNTPVVWAGSMAELREKASSESSERSSLSVADMSDSRLSAAEASLSLVGEETPDAILSSAAE